MRIVHISDSHLGFATYRALDKKWGINQREADISRAFSQAIDKIIDLKPKLVIHSGDLFDTVRPPNRTISFAVHELLRLAQKNIPLVMISGNHSTPKTQSAGNIFQLFELFDGFYPVYKGEYEKVSIDGINIHAIPQCLTVEDFEKNLTLVNSLIKKFKSKKKGQNSSYHILVLHAALRGIKEFSMGEFNEQIITPEQLMPEFSYIALGHYHQYTKIKGNTCYSGSTERMTFNEVEQDKGFVEVNLKTSEINFHSLDSRPMVDENLNLETNHDVPAVMEEIEKTLAEIQPQDKIVRINLKNISPPVHNSLDFRRLRELTAKATHFELRYQEEEKESAAEPAPTAEIKGLLTEFSDFVAQIEANKQDKQTLLSLGLEYLKRVGEEK